MLKVDYLQVIHMKRTISFALFIVLILSFSGCSTPGEPAQIAATTLPVYTFTQWLCQDTGLTVERLIRKEISCVHDETLSVQQVRLLESADVVILSGGGLEDYMDAALKKARCVIDSSDGLELIACDTEHDHDHHHEADPHFWLSPIHAKAMAQNICEGLTAQYPQHAETFARNLDTLEAELDKLLLYGQEQLSSLTTRKLITFHDGFSYFAHAFDLTILEALEEDTHTTASAAQLISLITLVREHDLPAVFTEKNGSVSAASTVCAETGISAYSLDMAISGADYFTAMYHNIHTVKEALECT